MPPRCLLDRTTRRSSVPDTRMGSDCRCGRRPWPPALVRASPNPSGKTDNVQRSRRRASHRTSRSATAIVPTVQVSRSILVQIIAAIEGRPHRGGVVVPRRQWLDRCPPLLRDLAKAHTLRGPDVRFAPRSRAHAVPVIAARHRSKGNVLPSVHTSPTGANRHDATLSGRTTSAVHPAEPGRTRDITLRLRGRARARVVLLARFRQQLNQGSQRIP